MLNAEGSESWVRKHQESSRKLHRNKIWKSTRLINLASIYYRYQESGTRIRIKRTELVSESRTQGWEFANGSFKKKTYKKRTKTYKKYDFSQLFWAIAHRYFIMSHLRESLTVALLSWETRAIGSQWFICLERSERMPEWAMNEWANSQPCQNQIYNSGWFFRLQFLLILKINVLRNDKMIKRKEKKILYSVTDQFQN